MNQLKDNNRFDVKSAEKFEFKSELVDFCGIKEGNGRVEIGGSKTFVDSQGDDGDERSEAEVEDIEDLLIFLGFSKESFIFNNLQHLFLTPTDVLPGNKEARAPQ